MAKSKLSAPAFAFSALGIDLYDWQIEVLDAISRGEQQVALRAANGSGKTAAVVAPALLWWLWRYPKGRVVVTSGSWRQVEDQLFPAARNYKHLAPFKGWQFPLSCRITTPAGGWAAGFSTDNPGRAEGYHRSQESPVLYIVDEAKSVHEGIFDAATRCSLDCLLITSSPGAPSGTFFNAFSRESSLWWTKTASFYDCPHLPAEREIKARSKYGEDHPVYRSMILGEFTEGDDRLVLSPEKLTHAIENQPPAISGRMAGFCDVAAGRDENVFAVCNGNQAKIVECWRERDTVQAARRFIKHFGGNRLRGSQVWVDSDGLGIGFVNQMQEEGFRPQEFHGGMPALDREHYANEVAEVWFEACREIEAGKIRFDGGIDPETFEQITSRRVEWDSKGRLRLESKDSLRARGLPSPDRADALLGAIAKARRSASGFTSENSTRVPPSSPWATPALKF